MAFIEYTGDSEAMIVYQAPSGKKYRFNSGAYSRRAIRGAEAISYFEKLVDFKVTRRA